MPALARGGTAMQRMIARTHTIVAVAVTAAAASLALMPPFLSGAHAQNGSSFLDAAHSGVRYSLATVQPQMNCASLRGLSTADTTIIAVETIAAADGVPVHCR